MHAIEVQGLLHMQNEILVTFTVGINWKWFPNPAHSAETWYNIRGYLAMGSAPKALDLLRVAQCDYVPHSAGFGTIVPPKVLPCN